MINVVVFFFLSTRGSGPLSSFQGGVVPGGGGEEPQIGRMAEWTGSPPPRPGSPRGLPHQVQWDARGRRRGAVCHAQSGGRRGRYRFVKRRSCA